MTIRIALVTWTLSPPFGTGGIARYVNRLATALCELGHEVVVFYAYGYSPGQTVDPFKVKRISVSNVPILRLFQFCRKLRKELSNSRFDIVHAHIPQLVWAISIDSILVVTIHTTSRGEAIGVIKSGPDSASDIAHLIIFKTIARALESAGIKRARTIITVNPSITSEVSHLVRNRQINIITSEPAVETRTLVSFDKNAARESLGIKGSDFVVLFVGRLDARKNPLVLLEAFAQAISGEAHQLRLIYCGEGSLGNKLRRRISELSLDGVVNSLGLVDEETLSKVYSAADVFILPSEIEGFPATLLECRQYGLPAIVGPYPGVEAAIVHGFNGIVLDAINVGSIAAQIGYLLNNPSKLREMSSNSLRMAHLSNSWPNVAKESVEVYKAMLKG